MTSMVCLRTGGSAVVMERPLGVTNSQCKLVISMPESAAARRRRWRSAELIEMGIFTKGKGRQLQTLVAGRCAEPHCAENSRSRMTSLHNENLKRQYLPWLTGQTASYAS